MRIIADNLSKAGWSWGRVSAIDSKGRTIWIADAHRVDGKRFVVHADEKLTAFVELESAISKQMTNRQLLGILGSVILFIGFLCPSEENPGRHGVPDER